MAEFWTKQRLYNEVDYIRSKIEDIPYPCDSHQLIKTFCLKPEVVSVNFESSKICGMLIKGKTTTTIGVNANHSKEQQNFYLMHELFHYLWHDDKTDAVKFCNDIFSQNDFAEWQANEAAAEMLMPYRKFIPSFVSACKTNIYYGSAAIRDAKNQMATRFGVTERMIHMRVNALKYPISQYQKGAKVDELQIISQRKQDELGIKVLSYNDIEHELELQEAFTAQYSGHVQYRGWE